MTKAQLRDRFDKVYNNGDVTELVVDLFNYLSSQQLEEFYEFILNEKGLTDKQVKYLD